MPSRIVRVPYQYTRHRAVHSHGHETSHPEADAGRLDVSNRCVAGDRNGQHDEHREASQLDAVGNQGDEDCLESRSADQNLRYATICMYVPVVGVATA